MSLHERLAEAEMLVRFPDYYDDISWGKRFGELTNHRGLAPIQVSMRHQAFLAELRAAAAADFSTKATAVLN